VCNQYLILISLRRCEAQAKIGDARETMLQNPTLSASDIIKATVGELPCGDNENGPKLSTLKRSLYRYRKSVQGARGGVKSSKKNKSSIESFLME